MVFVCFQNMGETSLTLVLATSTIVNDGNGRVC